MPPRIAIPVPHSFDSEYAGRAMSQYERAVELAGGEPVPIPFDAAQAKKIMAGCQGVLLPGSKADVDPAKFHRDRSTYTAAADSPREELDRLLLEDAYKLRKPVLGICYGLQSLNVHRAGTLIQHIPDFLPEEMRTKVNHEAGKKVAVAHTVEIAADSALAKIVAADTRNIGDWSENAGERHSEEGHGLSCAGTPRGRDRALAPEAHRLVIPVNSSHHQSADVIGEGLRVAARCREDQIIEAIEGTALGHFVLAVQWHPERSVDDDAASIAIFRGLIDAAR